MALTKHGIRANGLSFLRDQTVEREREERKREEKRKRKRKKRRRREAKIKQNGMELTFDMNYSMDHMDFVWLIACLQKLGFC